MRTPQRGREIRPAPPLQDQSSFDAFRFRRTRMNAMHTSANTPAPSRIMVLLSEPVSGAAWISQRANMSMVRTFLQSSQQLQIPKRRNNARGQDHHKQSRQNEQHDREDHFHGRFIDGCFDLEAPFRP